RAVAVVRVAEEGRADLAPPAHALRLAFALDRLQLGLQPRDLFTHHAAVGFQLRLARAARADAAGLALEVLPHAGEPRQRVLELRQLDLQATLTRPRTPGKDVEDQLAPVHDLPLHRLLQVLHLPRREGCAE